ncbi:hypothetical protein JY456_03785 [Stenotrophomonas maltophilia]|nr:hypothetical protein [Stenotrophomonas maltophilia]
MKFFYRGQARKAAANRATADHALHDTQFTERERHERSAYYTHEAERWEFQAALGGPHIDSRKDTGT